MYEQQLQEVWALSMKHLTIITALLMTFATQAVAGETLMACNAVTQVDPEKRYYKLVKPLFGEPSVQQKVKGKWVNWCRPRPTVEIKPCELEIYDSAAKLTAYFLPDATSFRAVHEYLIDFEFGTRTNIIKRFKSDKEFTGMQRTWKYSCEIQE